MLWSLCGNLESHLYQKIVWWVSSKGQKTDHNDNIAKVIQIGNKVHTSNSLNSQNYC